MTWYAIRVKPAATHPFATWRREPLHEESKATALVRHASAETTQLEAALQELGLQCFVPMERKALIHHRSKQQIIRRFPLIAGWAFVADVRNWVALEAVSSVARFRADCPPAVIPDREIERIREAEAQINVAHVINMMRAGSGSKWTAYHHRRLQELFPGTRYVTAQETRKAEISGREAIRQISKYLDEQSRPVDKVRRRA